MQFTHCITIVLTQAKASRSSLVFTYIIKWHANYIYVIDLFGKMCAHMAYLKFWGSPENGSCNWMTRRSVSAKLILQYKLLTVHVYIINRFIDPTIWYSSHFLLPFPKSIPFQLVIRKPIRKQSALSFTNQNLQNKMGCFSYSQTATNYQNQS